MKPATVINILNDLKPYNSTYSSVAKKYDVSVTTVIDIGLVTLNWTVFRRTVTIENQEKR